MSIYLIATRGRRGRMVVGLNSPINTNVVSSNPVIARDTRPHYVIKFLRNLRQVSGFSPVLRFSSPIQTDNHDITEILLKLKLTTINLIIILTTKPENYIIRGTG